MADEAKPDLRLEGMLDLDFFARPAEDVAVDLLGRELVRQYGNKVIIAEILATGAYEGGEKVKQRIGMWYAPGTIFLMPFRGHNSLNIATREADVPSVVEIRAARFLDSMYVAETPFKLAKELHLDARSNDTAVNLSGLVLGQHLYVRGPKSGEEVRVERSVKKAPNCIAYYSIG